MKTLQVRFVWDCYTAPTLFSSFGIKATVVGGPVPEGKELHWDLDRVIPWLEDHGYTPESTVVEAGKRLHVRGFVRPVVWKWGR